VSWVYKLEYNGTMVILPKIKKETDSYKLAIPCLSKLDAEVSTFNKLAKISCNRDVTEILRTNEYLTNEFNQIINPPYVKKNETRKKRAVMLGGVGLLSVEAMANAFSGKSPLNSVGKGISYTLGIATHSDVHLTRKELLRHAHAIDNITINQQLLAESYNKLVIDVHELTKNQARTQHDMAVLFVNFDSRGNIYRMQGIIQDCIIKMVQALQTSALLQTSPYVFGRKDLTELTKQFRINNIPLTNNIEEVMTQVVLVEKVYTFLLSIPIINTVNNFNLYEVKALPVFKNGEGFRVMFENKYIAINAMNMEYFTTSETEFNYCTQYPFCTVSKPFRKIIHDSPCEVRSLKLNSMVCSVEQDNKAKASFISNQNMTYFSVPEPMEIHAICSDAGTEFNEHKTINDYGFFNIPDGCEVKVGNDISLRPGFIASVHTLTDNTLFEILNFPEDIHDFPERPNISAITRRPLLSFESREKLAETFDIIFDHETAMGEFIRIGIYITVFVVILLIIYCSCPKCRLWVHGCCFLTKPTVYWRKVRGYKVPDYQNPKSKKNRETNSEEIREQTARQFSFLTQRLRKLTSEYTLRKAPEPTNTYKTANELDEIVVSPPQDFRSLHVISDPKLYPTTPFPK